MCAEHIRQSPVRFAPDHSRSRHQHLLDSCYITPMHSSQERQTCIHVHHSRQNTYTTTYNTTAISSVVSSPSAGFDSLPSAVLRCRLLRLPCLHARDTGVSQARPASICRPALHVTGVRQPRPASICRAALHVTGVSQARPATDRPQTYANMRPAGQQCNTSQGQSLCVPAAGGRCCTAEP